MTPIRTTAPQATPSERIPVSGLPRMSAARGALAVAVASLVGVGAAAAGVFLGTPLQDQLEARPTAAQREALEASPSAPAVDAPGSAGGPNRAVLGVSR